MILLRGWESVLIISPSLTLEYIFPRENIKQKERERQKGGERERERESDWASFSKHTSQPAHIKIRDNWPFEVQDTDFSTSPCGNKRSQLYKSHRFLTLPTSKSGTVTFKTEA